MAEEQKVPESFKAYEEGKHRRYNLFFAVNAGACSRGAESTANSVVERMFISERRTLACARARNSPPGSQGGCHARPRAASVPVRS